MDTTKERKILHELRGPTQEYVWLNDTLSRALDEIDSLNKESEWVSVEDRLPIKHERVLVYLGDRGSPSDIQIWVWFNRDEEKVTHWMPMPAPPTPSE